MRYFPKTRISTALNVILGSTLLGTIIVSSSQVWATADPVAERLPTAYSALNRNDLEVMIVTASGTAANELSTPHATTILTQKDIQQKLANTLAETLRGEPGLFVHSDGAWGNNPVIRGLKKEQIVILVDGIRINAAQPAGAISSTVIPENLEKIEVIKGPMSVLYGSGAMGGVINLLTQQQTFSDQPVQQGSYSLTASSVDDGFTGAADYSCTSSAHQLTVSASGGSRDDYESPEGHIAHSGFDDFSFNAIYKYQIEPGKVFRVNTQYYEANDVWYPASKANKPLPIGTRLIRSPEQTRSLLSFGYNQKLFDSLDGVLDIELYQQEVFRIMQPYSLDLDKALINTRINVATTGGRITLRFHPHDNHRLSIGIDGWELNSDPSRLQMQPPAFTHYRRNDHFSDAEIISTGLFVQDEIMLDNWDFKVGVRYDHVRGDAEAAALPAFLLPDNLDSTDDLFSWSLGGVYHLSDWINPYASLAQGVRVGDLRERFESALRSDGYMHVGNPQIEPEKNTAFEVGLKGGSHAARYSANLHYSRIDDYIDAQVTGFLTPGGPVKYTTNIDEVVVYGIEGQYSQYLAEQLNLHLAVSWLRGENRELDEPLYQTPAPELSIGLHYQPEFGFNWEVTGRLVREQTRVAAEFSNGTENPTAGFATMDLAVGYQFSPEMNLGDLNIRLTVKNLFDKAYHEHLTEGLSNQEISAPGRNILLSLRSRF